MPPYFVKLTDDEIVAHYTEVCAATGMPVVLYNIPGNAVNALPPALVSRLADIPTVVAVKESSGDWNNYYGTYLAVHDRLRVFCGPSSVFGVPAVELGADGTIDCFPNVWRKGGLDLYFAAARGDKARAAERCRSLAASSPTCSFRAAVASTPPPRRPWTCSACRAVARRALLLRALKGEPLKGLETGLKALHLLYTTLRGSP